MMLREMAAAMLLLTAAAKATADDLAPPPALTDSRAAKNAREKKKNSKKPLTKAEDAPIVVEPAPPMATVHPSSAAPIASTALPPVPDKALAPPSDPGLALLGSPNALLPLPTEVTVKPDADDNRLLPLDLEDLMQRSLCIFPFTQEDTESDPAKIALNKVALDQIHETFVSIAGLMKGVKVKTQGANAPTFSIDDTAQLAPLGAHLSCGTMVVGAATHFQDGFSLRVRFIDTDPSKVRVLAKLDKNLATNSNAEWRTWTQGQACSVFSVKCSSSLKLDADRETMRLIVGSTTLQRKPGQLVQTYSLNPPGLYTLSAFIGTNYSKVHLTLAAGLDETKTVYVRQRKDGSILIDDKPLPATIDPPPSANVAHIVGIVSASLGVVALGVGGQQALHSKSLADDATANYNANGGYYQPGQLGTATGVGSAKTNAVILTAVGAGLIALGGILYFAF
jgi:hypothetical protein